MLIDLKSDGLQPDKNIELFWKMYRLARMLHDHPMVWKIDEELINSLAKFLLVEKAECVLTMNFLDASVDQTFKEPALICLENTYPFTLVKI
jgi:hypothetical protein